MSNALSNTRNSNHPRLPNRPPLSALRPPSTRDIDIYKRVKIQGAFQQSVAWHYKLHTSRVSQIVKRVRRWLAAGGAVADPQVRDHAARQSLSRATHTLRLQRAIELVTFALEGDRSAQKSSRSRTVGGIEAWREETVKPPPDVDLKAIRLLLRLTESLQQLQDRDDTQPDSTRPQPQFGHDVICEQELISFVFEHLCQWRAAAEQYKRLPRCADIRSLVAGAMDQVLGTNLAADFAAPVAPSEPGTQESLNMSASPSPSDSATDAPATPCDEPFPPGSEKSLELEPHQQVATCDSETRHKSSPGDVFVPGFGQKVQTQQC